MSNQPTTKFYKLKQGAVISGVCAGLADKFNWDVTVVRLVFLALLFTNIPLLIIYIVLASILPYKEVVKRPQGPTTERRRKEADVIQDEEDGWFW